MDRTRRDPPKSTAQRESLVEYEAGLRIDKNDLDGALVEQADIFYRVSRNAAQARSDRDALKLDRDNAIAELDMQFRKSALEREEKITEKGIEKEIDNTVRMRDLRSAYLSASRSADMWEALKEAFQMRAYALKDLVSLYSANYYASSVGGGARNDAKDRRQGDYNQARADAMRDRR